MNSANQITHDGFIQSIDDKIISVRIISKAGCVSCTAKSSCSVSDIEEKIVEVRNTGKQDYKIGDAVVVALDQNKGFVAVFIGYILPFFVLLFTLIVGLEFTDNEGLVGLIALGMLIPYYFLVYILKEKIRNHFSFKIV